jgi:uncharacterized protein (DUF2336 family)
MPRIAREIDDALKAVTLARCYFHSEGPQAQELDLQLWRLLKHGSAILRAEMADQLSEIPNGPPCTLRALACDPDPEVASPVLQRWSAICDVAIAEMARCKGDDHLCAIAARENLNEKIFGILARRGGKKVLDVLAANRTARSSAEGRHTMERRLSAMPAPSFTASSGRFGLLWRTGCTDRLRGRGSAEPSAPSPALTAACAHGLSAASELQG